MAEAKESLRDKITLAVVQTVILGGFMAVLGWYLDSRQEVLKQELAVQTEQTKTLLSALQPQLALRRDAYLEFLEAARRVKQAVEGQYYMAEGPSPHEARTAMVEELANDMGLGSGGSGGGFQPRDAALRAVREFVEVQRQYADVTSDAVEAAMDRFINQVVSDLRQEMDKSNRTPAFHNAARNRLLQEYRQLEFTIENALGIAGLPIK